MLGVKQDATKKEIKLAYYELAKGARAQDGPAAAVLAPSTACEADPRGRARAECHPDLAGEEGHEMCILLNDAYELLSDPKSRESYDYDLELAKMDDGYTGKPLSKWSKRHLKEGETRAVYVDESACIGCKQCVWAASATFRMEDDYGRSRVFAQWLNSEDDIQCAIDSCPVDCIHWVHKDELPALEFVTQRMVKQSVGIMMGTGEGGGQRGTDPFAEAKAFLKQRERFVRLKLKRERESRERVASEAEAKRRTEAAEQIAARTRERWGKLWGNTVGNAGRRRRQWIVPPHRALVKYVPRAGSAAGGAGAAATPAAMATAAKLRAVATRAGADGAGGK